LNWKRFSLLGVVFVAILTVFFIPAIPQDIGYHDFADNRTFFGVPNFFNVISNLPYLIFGLIGYYLLFKEVQLHIIQSLKLAYTVFFIGVTLVCLGSGYYHLDPDNSSLLWDRLPMTLAFMSFFTVILGEYVHEKTAQQLYFPLLIIGLISVVYWYWSETINQGDLRLYVLVQFLPIVLIPLILWLFPSRFTHGYYYWLIIACYVLAKAFELTDQLVFDTLGIVSGHSLKHLISTLVPFLMYKSIKSRTCVKDS